MQSLKSFGLPFDVRTLLNVRRERRRCFVFPLGAPCARCPDCRIGRARQNTILKFKGEDSDWQLVSRLTPPTLAGGFSCLCFSLPSFYAASVVPSEQKRVQFGSAGLRNSGGGVGGWQPLDCK